MFFLRLNINVIFLSTNLRKRPRKSAVVTQNGPPQSRTQIGFVWVSQHAQKIITLLILSVQVLSPFFHPSSAQDSDAHTGSYSNRNVYQFSSRSFSWDNVLGQRLLIYMYTFIFHSDTFYTLIFVPRRSELHMLISLTKKSIHLAKYSQLHRLPIPSHEMIGVIC